MHATGTPATQTKNQKEAGKDNLLFPSFNTDIVPVLLEEQMDD